MLTGQRLKEVENLTWVEIDEEARLWTLPAVRAKNNRSHLVPLSGQAIDLLDVAANDSNYVFTAAGGAKPFSNWSRFKKQIDALLPAQVEPWRFRDFRRSFASGCAGNGIDPMICDMVLNHTASGTRSGIMRVYQTSRMLDRRREALDLWGGLPL